MKKTLLLKTMLLLCVLIVGSTSAWAQEVTLDLTDNTNWGFPVGSGNGLTAENSYSDGTYTIKLSATTKYYYNTDGYLMIGKNGSKLTLPAFDFDVEKIVVTGNSAASADTKMNVYVGTTAVSTETKGSKGTNTYEIADGYQTKGNVFILQVTSNHNAQITQIDIYKKSTGGNNVVTPTFNPVAGEYKTKQDVTINCGTDGATIHYTMTEDGTTPADPTESDATYSAAISMTKSGTKIKAKAFKDGMTPSSAASATYTIKPNTPDITATGATVTISGDEGLSFYYTTDNSAPTNESTAYTAPFELDADCTIKAIGYDAYGNASSVKTLNYKYMPLNPKNINSGYYEKVTDVSTLENGDAILIVNEGAKLALSTEQRDNNRGSETITISNNTISDPSADVQKLILVKKTETIEDVQTDVFYFYTGSGYLYAASGSSNHLKTEATPDNNNNARATISISSGDATIAFTGTSTRNVIRSNSGNNPPIFSCYASDATTGFLPQIYKEVAKKASATIPANKEWITFCSTENLDFTSDIDGLEGAYTITAHENQAITLTATEMTGTVKAGTGLLLRAAEKKDVDQVIAIPVAATGEEQADNMLKGVTADTEVQPTAGDYTNLGLSNGEFHPYSAAGTLAAGKAYLQIPTAQMPTGGNNARLYIVLDGDATGISTLDHFTISPFDNNAPMYNLAGQRVTKSYKGVVIVNGKKYINK